MGNLPIQLSMYFYENHLSNVSFRLSRVMIFVHFDPELKNINVSKKYF